MLGFEIICFLRGIGYLELSKKLMFQNKQLVHGQKEVLYLKTE